MRQFIIVLILINLFFTGCAPKKQPQFKTDDWECPLDSPADLKNFPQNLQVYAAEAGKNRLLISPPAQAELNEKFNRIYFGPWQMTRSTIRKGEISGILNRARGYNKQGVPWSQAEWDEMRRNANLSQFPSFAASAITLRNTDLREAPTHEPRFTEPTLDVRSNPFDYFQFSHLPIGTPLLIAHTSLDGRWYYAECPITGGWVDARDVAFVDNDFKRLWLENDFAALIQDNVILPGTGPGGGDSKSGIGATLPLRSVSSSGQLKVLVPVRGKNGFADSAEIPLAAGAAVKRPWAMTPEHVAAVGNVMRGQPYGWGGMLGERDCSALTRDIFTPFGIWLPRNSAAQAKRGSVVSLQGMTAEEKARTIMQYGTPFLSLLGMKGHITLYIGQWKGQPAIFHNVWGLRVVKNGNDNERLVIGRAVITSITPGMELENLYRPVTFVDRLRTLTTPGGN